MKALSAFEIVALQEENAALRAQIKEAVEQEPYAWVKDWQIYGEPLPENAHHFTALYAHPPIREGWVMVPLEPTREMLDAAHQDFWSGKELDKLLKDAYRLMLSAVKKD